MMKVFDRARELIDYTMVITDNTKRFPKKARFTFVDRMQNMTLDIYRKLASHGNCYGLIKEMDILYKNIFEKGDGK